MRTCFSTTVIIDGEACTVTLVKTGSTTWQAYGNVKGKSVPATGRSESHALETWRRLADYLSKD